VSGEELEAQVIELISRELAVPEASITGSTVSADVERWDSLGHLQICMALEAEFGISPELEELAELDSVAAIVVYLGDRA
jgi:acyl carrier protein